MRRLATSGINIGLFPISFLRTQLDLSLNSTSHVFNNFLIIDTSQVTITMQRSTSSTASSSTRRPVGRPAKRSHTTMERSNTNTPNGRERKRMKSENLSFEDRYLVATATVIFTKTDLRPRHTNGNLMPVIRPGRKCAAPSSDLSQTNI